MSQMNNPKGFQKGVSPTAAKPGKLADLKGQANAAKNRITAGNAKIDRAIDAVQKGADKDAQAYNFGMGKGMVQKGTQDLAAAKQQKAAVKSQAPKGPVMGARTGTGSAPNVPFGKQAPKPGTPLTSPAVGGAKMVTAFKSAGPSNPMGRMGGKPGVNLNNDKK